MPEAEMIAHFVDGMGGFLLRKHKELNDPELAQRIFYNDYSEFNDWLDTQNDPIVLPIERTKEIPFSFFLYRFDMDTYRAMLLQYIQTETEDSEEDKSAEKIVAEHNNQELQIKSEQEGKLQVSENGIDSTLDRIKDIADALILNDEVRASITDEECVSIANFVQDYAENRAGLDWQNRESLVAKFRLKVRRELIKFTYSEAFLDYAVDILIDKAKQYFPSGDTV